MCEECMAAYDFAFGIAIYYMRECKKKVAREGWNGKEMYIELQTPDENSKMTQSYIYMKTADDQLVPWTASQTDILSTDWYLVDEKNREDCDTK